MSTIKHISTLVSIGRNPISGEARHCHNDSLAMTLGLTMEKSASATYQVLHAGNPKNKALTEYLALGASQIDVIPIVDNTDIVHSLAAQLSQIDLILTGSRAESGEDSGLLPYLLAEKLGIPLVVNALAIEAKANAIQVLQFLPKGKRRNITVKLPAIIAIHPLAPVSLKFAYARQISGEINILPTPHPTSLENYNKTQWQINDNIRKPIKLKAAENKSGHARMLAAISSESKGGAVVIDGNSVEKAQVILSYLREHCLINF